MSLPNCEAIGSNALLFTAIMLQCIVIALLHQSLDAGPLKAEEPQQASQIIIRMVAVDGYLLVSLKKRSVILGILAALVDAPAGLANKPAQDDLIFDR